MTFGKPILVMPRRGHLNEHRTDHQRVPARLVRRQAPDHQPGRDDGPAFDVSDTDDES